MQCGYNFNNYRDPDGKSAIHLAIKKRDIKLLKAMFDTGCEFNQMDEKGQNPFSCDPAAGRDILMKAVRDKKPNIPFLLKILKCGVDINSEDDKGQTALFQACKTGNERLVKTLLEEGASIHHQDHEGNTPIITISQGKNTNICQVLLDAGANIHDRNKQKTTPILNAAQSASDFLLRTLLQNGANINDTNAQDMTPLLLAMQSQRGRIIEMLVENDALVYYLEDRFERLLDMLKKHFSIDVYGKLMRIELDPKKKERVLKVGAESKQIDMSSQIATAQLNPSVKSPSNETYLKGLLEEQDFQTARILIKKGAHLDDTAESLCNIAMCCDLEALQKKLELGANPNEQDSHGCTVVHKLLAYEPGNNNDLVAETLKCLLRAGADPNIQNNDGDTPLHLTYDKEMYGFLLENGANVNICNKHSRTPLSKLLNDAFIECLTLPSDPLWSFTEQEVSTLVKLSIEHGADPTIQDCDGKTALDMAVECSHAVILEQLLQSHIQSISPFLCFCMLLYAIEFQKQSLVEVLLKHGADPSAIYHKVTIHMALNEGYRSIFTKQFVEMKKSEINSKNDNSNSLLALACGDNDIEAVQILLEYGADINIVNNSGETALFFCKSPQCAKLLLEKDNENKMYSVSDDCLDSSDVSLHDDELPAVNAQDKMGKTPLIHASLQRDTRTAEFLIMNDIQKADLNIVDHMNQTALSTACQRGRISMLDFLELHDTRCETDTSTLIEAFSQTQGQQCSMMVLLLKHSSDCKIGTDSLITVCKKLEKDISDLKLKLQFSTEPDTNKLSQIKTFNHIYMERDITQLLSQHNIECNIDTSSLMQAFKQQTRYISLMELLLQHCMHCHTDYVALYEAFDAEQTQTSLIRVLLQNGADCNIGASSLIEAFNHGSTHIMELLLNLGCNPNQTNAFGETLLLIAAQSRTTHNHKVLETLKTKEDLDVNVRDEHGKSLVHLAAAHKPYLLKHVPFLINHGVDLNTTDAYGRTILHDWKPQTDSLAQLAFRQLLLKHIDVNHQDYNGHTAMHLAVMEKDEELQRKKCRELLKFGADLSIKDKNGLCIIWQPMMHIYFTCYWNMLPETSREMSCLWCTR